MNTDIAQICQNGHIVNPKAKTCSLNNKNYCSICSSVTTMVCNHCNTPIEISKRIYQGRDYLIPKTCVSCQTIYPWNEKAINAAHYLIELEGSLSEGQKNDFKKSIEDIVLEENEQTFKLIQNIRDFITNTSNEFFSALMYVLKPILREPTYRFIEGSSLLKARQEYQKGDFTKSKEYYDLYIDELNDAFNYWPSNEELDLYYEIANEYIDIIIKVKHLNITESNPLFIKYDEISKEIKGKIEKKESLARNEILLRTLCIHKVSEIVDWADPNNWSHLNIMKGIMEYPHLVFGRIEYSTDFLIEDVGFLTHRTRNDSDYFRALETNLIKNLILNKWGADDPRVYCSNSDEPWEYGYEDGPEAYGYGSWDEMAFYEAFNGDKEAWDHYNQ